MTAKVEARKKWASSKLKTFVHRVDTIKKVHRQLAELGGGENTAKHTSDRDPALRGYVPQQKDKPIDEWAHVSKPLQSRAVNLREDEGCR